MMRRPSRNLCLWTAKSQVRHNPERRPDQTLGRCNGPCSRTVGRLFFYSAASETAPDPNPTDNVRDATVCLPRRVEISSIRMTKRLIDVDDEKLAEVRVLLGTSTETATVNGALGEVIALAKQRE